MPFPATLPSAIFETILTHLATLFLTGAAGDTTAARHAASQMLAAYNPETEAELRLAATVIGFSFHALEALSQATDPEMSLTRVLRLRGSAVSLSRQSANAERRLMQLQKARRQAIQAQPEEAQPAPNIEPEQTTTVAAAAKAKGLTWTRAYQQRQRDNRLAASRKKAQARNPPQPSPVPDRQPVAQGLTPAAPPTTHSPCAAQ